MVRRHFRLFGLLGLLVTLFAAGCGTARPRPAAPVPQPLGLATPDRQSLPEPAPVLAIIDKPPPPAPSAQQPLPQPVLQTAQTTPPALNLKPITAPSPPVAVPVSNGTAAPPAASSPLRTLYRLCKEKNDTLDAYMVHLRRREVVNGKQQPEEHLLFKFRKEPWAVYFKCLSDIGNGREVLYVKGRYNDQMHILTGKKEGSYGAFPIPEGMRTSKVPTDPDVMKRSRHPITEAGIGNLIAHFGKLLDAVELGDPKAGAVRYLGPVQRPEYAKTPLEAVHQVIPVGREPQLPRGGQRWMFFDTALRLPVMVITVDDRGQEVEYYSYDRFLFPARFEEGEFSPENLGKLKN